MVKKIFAWIGVVILSLAALLVAYTIIGVSFAYVRDDEQERELIPIELITGIHTEATLKPGCYVDFGYRMPYSDDRSWIATFVEGWGQGIPVKKLWIVDVYGDLCTIVFTCSDNRYELYYAEDYPLANLNYNILKVKLADDRVKTTLYGSHYSLGNTLSSILAQAVCIEIGLVLGIILLVCKVIRPKKKVFRC